MDVQLINIVIMTLNVILFIIIGITLSRKGLKTHMMNLLLFGISNILIGLVYIMIAIDISWFIINIVNIIIYLMILVFVKQTFHREGGRTFKILVIISTISIILILTNSALTDLFKILEITSENRLLMNTFELIFTGTIFFWYGKSAYKSYKRMKNHSVESWIIKRIKIISYSSYLMAFLQVPDYFRINSRYGDFNDPLAKIVFFIQLAIITLSVIMQFLAWVMPKWFKKLINKKRQSTISVEISDIEVENQISEEELYNMLKND